MKDVHRQKLENRLTPIDLYKLTPKTNCRECGFETCLAFATQVIVGQGDLDACRYLDQQALQPFRSRLAEQHEAGIGVRREGFEKTLQFLRQEVRKWPFADLAGGLGARFFQMNGEPALELTYFGEPVTITSEDICRASGAELNPWEKVLLYNYVIGGAQEPSGVWVGMESLPNSVSKIKSLRAHCEQKLARAFAGKMDQLPGASEGLGRGLAMTEEKADFAADFQILPKLTLRVLWWDEDPTEGFESRVKFLFDSGVLGTLDLESLLFACEQLTDRLMAGSTGH